MKKIIVFGLAAVLSIAGMLGVFISPFHAGVVQAGGFTPFGAGTGVVAYYSIEGLPRRTAMVQDPVVIPTRSGGGNAYFRLVRPGGSGGNDVLIGHSGTIGGGGPGLSVPSTWTVPGMYEYRFFANGDLTGEPFHVFRIQVLQNEFTMGLPTNSVDILPNISVPYQSITLPLPTSFIDRQGRDLFTIRRNAQRELYVPYLAELELLHPNLTGFGLLTCDFAKLDMLKMAVFSYTTVEFRGIGEIQSEYRLGGGTDFTLADSYLDTIADPARRTFTPTRVWPSNHAEFTYRHPDGVIIASLQTPNIIIDNVQVTVPNVSSPTGQQRVEAIRDQIRFDARPEVSFVPTNMRRNIEVALPHPTVALSRETDRNNNAFNPIDLNASTVNNFTFARIEWRPNTAASWQLAQRLEQGEYYDFVTDFRFIPTQFGEYRIWYYTTTIFGAGFDHVGGGHIVTLNATAHPNVPAELIGERFIRYNPFGADPRFFVRFDTEAPEMLWTNPFDFDTNDIAVTRPEGLYLGGNVIDFELAPNRANYMVGRGTNSRTQISNAIIGAGLYNEHLLIIPALLGNSHTAAAGELVYSLTLTRHLAGAASPNSVTFASNIQNPAANGLSFHWDNTSPLVINFDDLAFENGQRHDGSATVPNVGNLSVGTHALVPSGTDKVARYTITVIVRENIDTGNPEEDAWLGRSTQETFSFNVVTPGNYRMHIDRPSMHGGIQLHQVNYHENDTISFRAINVSDPFTDSANIDVLYFLHYTSLGLTETITGANPLRATGIAAGVQFIDITDIVTFTGGNVNLPLIRDGSDVAFDLLHSIPASGMLTVNVIAVARNYFAMKNGFTFNEQFPIVIDSQPSGVMAMSVGISIFSEDYASSANVFGAQGAWNVGDRWEDELVDANPENPTFEQGRQIFLPEIFLNYDHDAQAHVSSVSVMIRHEDTGEAISPDDIRNGGASLLVPIATDTVDPRNPDPNTNDFAVISRIIPIDADNNIDQRISFFPNHSGVYTITIIVGNDGGNLTVLVVSVRVLGIANVTPSFVGGFADVTIRVGQTIALPSMFVTVNGEEFFTNPQNPRSFMGVERVWDPGANSGAGGYIDGDLIPVGNFTVTPISAVTLTGGNNFTASVVGSFTFQYVITVNVQALRDTGLDVAGTTIVIPRTFTVIVRGINNADIEINLMQNDFNNVRNATMGSGPALQLTRHDGSMIDVGSYNFLSEFGSHSSRNGDTITVGDELLQEGMRQVSADVYEYGYIFLPDWQAVLNSELTPPLDFNNRMNSWVTVQGPERGGAREREMLLDTSQDDVQQYVIAPGVNGDQRLYFFQPIGRLDGDGNRINPAEFVDGEYLVTFFANFDGEERTIVFRIMLGDTNLPRIYFTDADHARLFEVTRREGATFRLDTTDIQVDQNNSRTAFTQAFIARNVEIRVSNRVGAVRQGPNWENGDINLVYTTQQINDAGENARQIFEFLITTAGEWVVEIVIRSEADVEARQTFRFYVEETPPGRYTDTGTIWGIILIVLSSGVLLGVVIYFIKTGRDTKFAGAAGAKGAKSKGKGGAPKAEAVEKPDEV